MRGRREADVGERLHDQRGIVHAGAPQAVEHGHDQAVRHVLVGAQVHGPLARGVDLTGPLDGVLERKDSALDGDAPFLAERDDWKLVYSDTVASIFVKNVPENRYLIEKYSGVKPVFGKK